MIAGIRAVQRARDRLATGPRLFAAVLVQECSYRRLAEFYDLTLGTLGLEKCKLNFLQPTFGGDVSRDEYFAAAIIRDPDELLRVIRACDQEFLLRLRPAWYRTVELWARALAADPEAWRGYWGKQLPESICNAADRNIAIDSWGKMRLCFAYMWGWTTWSKAGDLRRFWENDALELRDAMRGCARYCGISHSLRRESATVEDNGT
jgi:hypothetical protein